MGRLWTGLGSWVVSFGLLMFGLMGLNREIFIGVNLKWKEREIVDLMRR